MHSWWKHKKHNRYNKELVRVSYSLTITLGKYIFVLIVIKDRIWEKFKCCILSHLSRLQSLHEVGVLVLRTDIKLSIPPSSDARKLSAYRAFQVLLNHPTFILVGAYWRFKLVDTCLLVTVKKEWIHITTCLTIIIILTDVPEESFVPCVQFPFLCMKIVCHL